ncbi:MAG: hypothetical protein RL693_2773, partial [Verrucomicrobiota bacterium]
MNCSFSTCRAFSLICSSVTSFHLLTVAPCHAERIAAQTSFFEGHCYDCHDTETKKGGLDLSALSDDLSKMETMAKWVRIHDRVASGEMPPPKKAQPEASEKTAFLKALTVQLNTADLAVKGTVIRRLNRVEYENTVHDLLGIRSELRELLPEDGKAFGFDNNSDALDLSSVHLQRYMDAAALALRDAVKKGPAPERQKKSGVFDAGRNAENIGKSWHKLEDGSLVFFNNGGFPDIKPDFAAPTEGLYQIKITGQAYQSTEPVSFSIYAGTFGRSPDTHLIGNYQLPPNTQTLLDEGYLRANEKLRIVTQLAPDKSLRENGPAAYKGVGLALQPFEIEGPIVAAWPGVGYERLFGKLLSTPSQKLKPKNSKPSYEIITTDAATDAKQLLTNFLPLAFRRPVTEDQMAPYLQLAQKELNQGANFEEAMRTAYIAVLCAPEFLFLREPAGKLDDFALASRLSYMLWS